jgi:TetR/AcrR family transcriptional regulator, ethionamide resistance regulator
MSQGREYGEDEVQALLRDALDALMADGTPLRDLSVGRLVTQAGMSRSTFYKYFDDKPAMVAALSAAALRRLYGAQRAWLDRGRDVTVRDVHDSMLQLLQAYLQDRVILRAVAEMSVYEPAIGEAYTRAVGDYARSVERFVRAGQADGWIDAALPAAETADALAWMTERTTSQVGAGDPPERLDALADALARIVTGALHP